MSTVSPTPFTQPDKKYQTRRRLIIGGCSLLGLTTIGGINLWQYLDQRHPLLTYSEHTQRVVNLSWSPDGTMIASNDGIVRLWQATGDHALTTLQKFSALPAQIELLAWSPNGTEIATLADNKVILWKMATATSRLKYEMSGASEVQQLCFAWSPDGKAIASAFYKVPDREQVVRVWDTSTGRTLQDYPVQVPSYYTTLAWSPDGRYLAGAGFSHESALLTVWETQKQQTVLYYKNKPKNRNDTYYCLAWSPSGAYLAVAGSERIVFVWEPLSQRQIYRHRDHGDIIQTVAWSPDSHWIASGSLDTTVQIWTPFGQQPASTYNGHAAGVYTVAWSPDGQRIASGSDDHTIQIWQP